MAQRKILIFMFWECEEGKPVPDIVKACMERFYRFAGDRFKVLVVNRHAAPAPPGGWDRNWGEKPLAHIKDYVSFHLVRTFGGIWFDASIILIKPIDEIFDLTLGKFQGFYAPGSDGRRAENWAFFAPPECPIMQSWYDKVYHYLETHNDITSYLWQHDIFEE